MPNYNLALVPVENGEQFIKYASKLSYTVKADTYRLDKNKIPHISVIHFDEKESNLDNIWKEIETLNFPKSI